MGLFLWWWGAKSQYVLLWLIYTSVNLNFLYRLLSFWAWSVPADQLLRRGRINFSMGIFLQHWKAMISRIYWNRLTPGIYHSHCWSNRTLSYSYKLRELYYIIKSWFSLSKLSKEVGMVKQVDDIQGFCIPERKSHQSKHFRTYSEILSISVIFPAWNSWFCAELCNHEISGKKPWKTTSCQCVGNP